MGVIRLFTDDHNKVRELFKTFNGGGALTGAVRRMIGAVSTKERRSAIDKVGREPRDQELMPEEDRDGLGHRLAALTRNVPAGAAGCGRPPARAARESRGPREPRPSWR